MSEPGWQGAVDAAAVAELSWVSADGTPSAAGVVPLRSGDRAVVAMPYAYADRLRPLAALPSVALSLTEPRLTGPAWRPVVLTGRPVVTDDVEGAAFGDGLLTQELRKHPPSRAYADSALLRRENWWFLPRLLVALEPDAVRPLPPRTDPGREAVLVTADGGGPYVDVVAVQDWTARPLRLTAPASGPGAAGQGGPAALLAQDVSVPDLERWAQHLTVGRLDGDALHVEGPTVVPPSSGAPLGLVERWRRHRELERACRRGIAAAERALR